MPKTIACIIARTGSSRLPKKVLKKVTEDHSMIGYIIERVKMAKLVDEIYICTTQEKEDNLLEETASDYGVNIYRGSTDEVIERFMAVGRLTEADYLIRITGDNVFTSYEYLDQEIDFIIREDLDYVRLINVPLGATAEVMSYEALMNCYKRIDPAVSEYLLMFMFDPDNYKCGVIKPFRKDFSNITITVDNIQDMERTISILKYHNDVPLNIKLSQIIEIIEQNVIPGSYFSPDELVKMPYGKMISYKDFKKDMAGREQKSVKLQL